jgi:tRNA (guanine26-N2/guanine27-N2)-dimethyltransferase
LIISSIPEKSFYSSLQAFNRDLSLIIVQQYILQYFTPGYLLHEADDNIASVNTLKTPQSKIFIADVCSGIGIRALRYAASLLADVHVTLIEKLEQNRIAIEKNFKDNKIPDRKWNLLIGDGNTLLGDLSKVNNGTLSLNKEENIEPFKPRFHVIDIDPFGSPISFIPAALKSIVHNGLLCLTFTNASQLFGDNPQENSHPDDNVTVAKKEVGLISVLSSVLHEIRSLHCVGYPGKNQFISSSIFLKI